MASNDLAYSVSKLSRNPEKRLTTLRHIRDRVLREQQRRQQQRQKNPSLKDNIDQWQHFHTFFHRESNLYQAKTTSLVTTGHAETQDDQEWAKFLCLSNGATSLQALCDNHWVREAQRETQSWLNQHPVENTHRHNVAREILSILDYAVPPSPLEAIFCSPEKAATLVDSNTILVVRDQQLLDLSGQSLIHSLFTSKLDKWPNKRIRVTIPDLPTSGRLKKRKTIDEISQKIINGCPMSERWNILDVRDILETPYPNFLSAPEFQLLRRFYYVDRRLVSSRTLNFMLLSEGGNHTGPHVDGYGLATFITVQEGEVGFGWVVNGTPQDRQDIHEDNWSDSLKSKTRYMILRPGQTVFMPSGTIHFIFRRWEIPTLATGGHILTWKGIGQWLHIMKEQEKSKEPVDADVTEKSTKDWVSALNSILGFDASKAYTRMLEGLDLFTEIQNLIEVRQNSGPQAAR
ncbi:hypothetical protein ACLX1H_004960 [Fusarium chlamydosporum]